MPPRTLEPRPQILCSCSTCGADMHLRFTAPRDHLRPEVEESYPVYWCGACDWGQVWPRPTHAERETYYAISDYYTHTQDSVWPAQPRSLADRLRVHLAWRRDRGQPFDPRELRARVAASEPTLCEIGCGGGNQMIGLREAGFNTTGVEPDTAARALALELGLDVHPGEAERLPAAVADQRFDVVVMSHVLEHCIDIEQALAGARSILRPGGLFVVEVPNCSSLGFEDSLATWPWTDAPRHLSFFTPASLARHVERAGFTVEERQYYGYCRQFSNEWIVAEHKIWSAMFPDAPPSASPNYKRRAWSLLRRTLLADDDTKYDSIRLITRSPA